jgi:ligand-binding sensor protein
MNFEDLFDLEEIQELQDAFALSLGMASMITKPDGTPITKPSNFCRLCKDIIRKTPTGMANCMKSDAIIGKPNKSGPTIRPCASGGLWNGGAAICVEKEHIANWLIGQVRDGHQDNEQILKYADEIGADKSAYREALSQVTVMSKKQFENACNSLFLFAGQLSKLAYQNMKLRGHSDLLEGFNRELENRVKERTAELEKALKDLEEASGNIRKLTGLLPICSNCKKIRDDKGYWKRLEVYIQTHTDALFSHSICPECSKELYPDLQNDDEKNI